ncbi:hypothetical protein ABDJ38_13020 [Aurantiacibacter sp. DGU5]|uniref:Uncharacterized protein n=1 Tax=Aurantiacibacter flavus TaxID=3145232 RepID=A0ABV0CZ05_9SPHN
MSETISSGVPRMESPIFATDALADLSPDEQTIRLSLSRQGNTVIDFPDPEVGKRFSRFKATLSLQFDISFDGPAADKKGDKRGGAESLAVRRASARYRCQSGHPESTGQDLRAYGLSLQGPTPSRGQGENSPFRFRAFL